MARKPLIMGLPHLVFILKADDNADNKRYVGRTLRPSSALNSIQKAAEVADWFREVEERGSRVRMHIVKPVTSKDEAIAAVAELKVQLIEEGFSLVNQR